jgi:hypothetical protein
MSSALARTWRYLLERVDGELAHVRSESGGKAASHWLKVTLPTAMNSEVSTLDVSAILCADWGKETRKRAIYVADVAAREVRRLDASWWSVSAVLSEAARLASRGPVLATFDAPLGIPETYLAAAARVPSWRSPTTFLEFLTQAHCSPNFFEGTSVAADWKIEQPFFSVPVGEGGLGPTAAQERVDLYRAIDKRTGAKTLFAKSGIPGSVGSATCALWKRTRPSIGDESHLQGVAIRGGPGGAPRIVAGRCR